MPQSQAHQPSDGKDGTSGSSIRINSGTSMVAVSQILTRLILSYSCTRKLRCEMTRCQVSPGAHLEPRRHAPRRLTTDLDRPLYGETQLLIRLIVRKVRALNHPHDLLRVGPHI